MLHQSCSSQPVQPVCRRKYFNGALLKLEGPSLGELVPLEALFETRKLPNGKIDSPRRIFICGRAEFGKTTLCKRIVFEFLYGELHSKFDRLLWISLRKLKSKADDYSWLDLIQDTHLLQTRKWKQSRELYSDQFYSATFLSRTLLLFDGLDEILVP